MTAFKDIRKRLEVTQAELATHLGVTQGNVSFYERGQVMPPAVAGKLIEFAKAKGHHLTYDEIYATPAPQGAEVGHG